jgi:hypothetical protein
VFYKAKRNKGENRQVHEEGQEKKQGVQAGGIFFKAPDKQLRADALIGFTGHRHVNTHPFTIGATMLSPTNWVM